MLLTQLMPRMPITGLVKSSSTFVLGQHFFIIACDPCPPLFSVWCPQYWSPSSGLSIPDDGFGVGEEPHVVVLDEWSASYRRAKGEEGKWLSRTYPCLSPLFRRREVHQRKDMAGDYIGAEEDIAPREGCGQLHPCRSRITTRILSSEGRRVTLANAFDRRWRS